VIAAPALRALRDAAGAAAVREHEPAPLGHVRPAVTVAPADAAALSGALAVLAREGLAALVRGGGTRLANGNLPRAGDVWLDTRGLGGLEVDADEGVAHVGAGVRVAALRDAAREAGWTSPLDAPGEDATVGGCLAAGVAGPRALGLGRPRDVVLGLDVVLGSGARTRCGGRVVKNVSGYDLCRLYVGARGSLGVVERAWLRLRPRPQATSAWLLPAEREPELLAVEAARRPSARAAALADAALLADPSGPPGRDCVLVELAGDAPVVEDDAAWLERAGAHPLTKGTVLFPDEVPPGPGALRFRLAATPSRLAHARARLRAAGACSVAHPGLATVVATFDLERPDELAADAAWRAAREAAAGGACVLEDAPDWAREARDVFDARPATLPLLRALKRQYDPDGVLEPGRFAGRL